MLRQEVTTGCVLIVWLRASIYREKEAGMLKVNLQRARSRKSEMEGARRKRSYCFVKKLFLKRAGSRNTDRRWQQAVFLLFC